VGLVSEIIEKIKSSGLTGRGGACFPTGEKWQMVAESPEKERYIVCNASEGDPHCSKDKWLLENHLSGVIEGIQIAIKTIKPKKTYIYLAPHFKCLKSKIEAEIKNDDIEIFDKPTAAYAHGEETVALNAIEGKELKQRSRPPYPTEKGLFGKSTLINNVETFYWVGKIAKNEYKGEILVCISEEGREPIITMIKPEQKVSEVLEENGIEDDSEIELGGIKGKKGKISELDQSFEKTFACIYILKKGGSEVEIAGEKYEIKPHQKDSAKCRPYLDDDDVAITRDESKCIGCGLCRVACLKNNGLGIPTPEKVGECLYFRPDGKFNFSDSKCTRCGQCIMACPTGTLAEREHIEEVKKDLADPKKIVIAQTAPSMRVTIGEGFGMEPGTVAEGQMVAALKKLGFDYVFDTNVGADFTTHEEAHDLVERVKNNGPLPLFTSCCPARVKFIEDFHPELICNITTVRSPQQCLAVLIKTYFAGKERIDPKKISVVSVMPCVAKKFEARREGEDRSGQWDVDWVLTTREFIKILKAANIDLSKLEPEKFDNPLGQASGAGAIYGAAGGVMESAIRTFAHLYNNQKVEKVEYQEFRGMEGVKRATIEVGDPSAGSGQVRKMKIAIATGLANAKKIIDDIKDGIKYDYVEVLACPGGCVGGGGQPKPATQEIIDKRRAALYTIDDKKKVRTAHDNPIIKKVYDEFLGKPGGELAQKYLHTHYEKCQIKSGKLERR